MPKRIQRKRTKGWRMPPGAVYVGHPTKWGNPFAVGGDGTAQACVDLYRWFRFSHSIDFKLNVPEVKAELRGKDLACWCPLDQPCHADVLLEIANS